MDEAVRIDPESGRRVCHVSDPWTAEKGKEHRNWVHPEAVDVGTCADECCDKYECRVCGLHFRIEIAS